MKTQEIPLKERALCPECHKPFRMNSGYNYNGHLICSECAHKLGLKYKISSTSRSVGRKMGGIQW